MIHNSPHNIAFFGTPDRAVIALETLKSLGILPKLIVTQPDRPQGRKFVMTPPKAKVWAQKEKIPILQPDKLSDISLVETLKKDKFDVFVVVAYGKIIPEKILSIPKYGSLNVHGSLLPELRGASPIETTILLDRKNTGVTIIKMDDKVDHGPIVSQRKIDLTEWPMKAEELASIIVTEGVKLLVDILPNYISGKIKPVKQDENKVTLTRKISKEDGLIDLSTDPYQNLLKIKAFSNWPKVHFFDTTHTRISISDAYIKDGKLIPTKVTPEGKREMTWEEYSRGRKN